ncbi:MAG: hypothetical protein ABFD89_16900 [Bryobacteraceae bacterium]
MKAAAISKGSRARMTVTVTPDERQLVGIALNVHRMLEQDATFGWVASADFAIATLFEVYEGLLTPQAVERELESYRARFDATSDRFKEFGKPPHHTIQAAAVAA